MKVAIQVRSSDALQDPISKEIASQIGRIRGVDIADADSDFVLSLIATELKLNNGRSSGIMASWVVLHPLDPTILDRFIEPQNRAFAKLLLSDYQQFCRQRQVIWGDRDIKKLASYIVDDFEKTFIEPARTKLAATG